MSPLATAWSPSGRVNAALCPGHSSSKATQPGLGAPRATLRTRVGDCPAEASTCSSTRGSATATIIFTPAALFR